MTFPVLVQPIQEQFEASLVGAPQVRVVRPTREEAIAALGAEIAQRVGRGELLSLPIDVVGVADLAGNYADDPTLRQIGEDAYRDRDAEAQE